LSTSAQTARSSPNLAKPPISVYEHESKNDEAIRRFIVSVAKDVTSKQNFVSKPPAQTAGFNPKKGDRCYLSFDSAYTPTSERCSGKDGMCYLNFDSAYNK
jgi:hypothetical protein